MSYLVLRALKWRLTGYQNNCLRISFCMLDRGAGQSDNQAMTPTGGRWKRPPAASRGKVFARRYRNRARPSMPRQARQDQLRVRPKRPGWVNLPTVVSSLTAVAALIFTALSLQTTRQQISIDAQGEVTSRFTAAVNQLGSRNAVVESGAIFALGGIANDSEYWRPQIIMLLSDFILAKAGTSGRRSPLAGCPSTGPLPAGVTAALTVLSRSDLAQDRSATVNLTGACLATANLSGMDFPCANFDDVSLENAFLENADLDGASLDGANLKSASLVGTKLVGASLEHAVLGAPGQGAQLIDADLNYADLRNADLENVVLGGATLMGAHLDGAKVAPYPNVPAFVKAARAGRTAPLDRRPGVVPCSSGQ